MNCLLCSCEKNYFRYSFSSMVSLSSFVFWPMSFLYEIKKNKNCWLYLLLLNIVFVPKLAKKLCFDIIDFENSSVF